MVSGRRKGDIRKKPQYVLRYLNPDDDVPAWATYECASYADIAKVLKDNYNLNFSRDKLQNIYLNRNNKQKFYQNIKITKIKD